MVSETIPELFVCDENRSDFIFSADCVKGVCVCARVTCCMGFSAAAPGCLCRCQRACGIRRQVEVRGTAAPLRHTDTTSNMVTRTPPIPKPTHTDTHSARDRMYSA